LPLILPLEYPGVATGRGARAPDSVASRQRVPRNVEKAKCNTIENTFG
jgi:hypothetical protein